MSGYPFNISPNNEMWQQTKYFSKRIQGTVAQKKLRLAMDAGAQHIYICEHHKNVIQVRLQGKWLDK